VHEGGIVTLNADDKQRLTETYRGYMNALNKVENPRTFTAGEQSRNEQLLAMEEAKFERIAGEIGIEEQDYDALRQELEGPSIGD
jgi:hypothetical protein